MWEGVTTPTNVEAYLLRGINRPGSDNVTIDSEGVASIQSASSVIGPVNMPLDPQSKQGEVVIPMPISEDPAIAGVEVLLQWAAWDGAAWALSEVHSSLIASSPSLFAASLAGGDAPSGGSGGPEQAGRAVESWWAGNAATRMNAEKRRVVKRLGARQR